MTRLRTLIAANRACFALLLAATLLARLLIPTGFMPMMVGGTIRIALCSGTMSDGATTMTMPMPGMQHGSGESGKHGKAEAPCTFAGLGMAALGGAAPLLLAAMIAFAFVLAERTVRLMPPVPPGRLRPPLRAPPPRI